MKRLAVLSTHPIQYQGPWFRALGSHPEVDLEVLFCHRARPEEQAAAGFGVEFEWDTQPLEGYRCRFLRNVATKPTIGTFGGLDTPEIAEVIKREKFDAVITNGWNYKSAWQAMRACWRNDIPILARSDSHLFTTRNFAKRLAKWPLYNWFIPRLDACLSVGKWSREYFLHYGARPERVFTVPHAVDQNYFAAESARWLPNRNRLRAEWGIDPDSMVLLFAGKFIQKKRPLDFLCAIDQAAKRGAKLCGLMVGDGPLRRECETLASARGAPIRFAGFLNQSEITKAYVAADALVLPSDGGETWGLVVNEAMLCGRPCFVSSRVGCAPDLIDRGETGEIFSVGDIKNLVALISSYAATPQRLAEMGARAKRQMTAHSIEAAVESTRQALAAVTGTRKA
jgi:glycosyltransferase involved in cell wall biosynthesis